ncbi:hypothetical protein [Propionispora sp. 2/2-37]|uniref:hypothetical protein n=1 Tax=Propionispora sp. 2/2-37 TaxID=1677858 RepID=UPI0006BB9657|nr:hypothetical protein [Propionispora sp. 2/2-37]
MKKSGLFLLILCLLLSIAPFAAAKPAPNLTRVEITHIGADDTGWIMAGLSPKPTLYGQKFYIAVRFTGYPNPGRIFFYQNGNLIPRAEVTEPFGRKGLGNPHSVWVYQFAMPVVYGNGTIAVRAEGIQGGRHYDTIYGVTTVYHPEK